MSNGISNNRNRKFGGSNVSERVPGSGQRGTTWITLLIGALLLLAPATTPAENQSEKMKLVKPRELVRTLNTKYVIYQMEDEVGSETVVRRDYSDNSVEYQSEIVMKFTQGTAVEMETALTLEEESYFPMRFKMTKHVNQGPVEFDDITDIEWFANVAVVYKNVRGSEDTTRMVLPAGVTVLEASAAHHLQLPLFWYDKELGGVQSFNVLDPGSKRLSSATLRYLTDETIEIAGNQITAARYEFVRDKLNIAIYVDSEGRIVKADQGYMVYVLTESSVVSTDNE